MLYDLSLCVDEEEGGAGDVPTERIAPLMAESIGIDCGELRIGEERKGDPFWEQVFPQVLGSVGADGEDRNSGLIEFSFL